MSKRPKIKGGFYAVARGYQPGVFTTWEECERSVKGFSGARFKRFDTRPEADEFVAGVDAPSFPVPTTNILVAYTDGSCIGPASARSAGCGVFFGDNDERNVSEPFLLGASTNQRAELWSVMLALEKIDDDEHLLIKTDSMYTINCLTQWSDRWQRNGWRTASGGDVLNVDLIRPLLTRIKTRRGKVVFEHVKGHAGHFGNEMADSLAMDAAKKNLGYQT